MEIEEVRSIAKSRSISPEALTKSELIKKIQVSEGSFDCYATAYAGACDQSGCSWREDCFESARSSQPS